MERETKEFTTKKSNVKYAIKSWLTKNESKPIRKAYNKFIDYGSMYATQDQTEFANQVKFNFNPDAWDVYRDELVVQYIVSIEEKTDKLYDVYLNLRSEDADEIAQQIELYHNKKEGNFLEKGKK